MDGRSVRESQSELSEMALPIYANPLGNLLGGRIMHLIDLVAATAAMRHARSAVVTASVDSVTFLHPIHIGQLVLLRASVNRAFTTSMEIGVKVWVEDLRTGAVHHTNSSYVTFVALDEQGKPKAVPPVLPETPTEQRRYREAEERRKLRLDLRRKAIAHERQEKTGG